MLGNLRIRGKLALVVAVPLVAVALLTLPGTAAAMDGAQRADEIRRAMQTASRVTALMADLRLERQLSLGYLFEVVDRSRLVTQSARVTDRVADITLDARDGRLAGGGLSQEVFGALTQAEALAAARQPVLDRTATPQEVLTGFGAAITALTDSLRLVDDVDLADPGARQVAALDASLRLNEVSNEALELLLVVAATGSTEAATGYTAALRRLDDHIGRFDQYATAEQAAQLQLMNEAFTERDETGAGAVFGEDPYGVTAGQSAATIFPPLESLSQLGRFVETKIITDVLIDVEAQGQAARRTAYLSLAGAVLTFVTVVVLTALLARTVVRPMLGLTASANRVALMADAELARIADEEAELTERTGPVRIDPVHIGSRDEIGDLARAFNRVQDTAVRLVERQVASRRNVALMFGYLGRRTQNLVGRQLAVIDQLEQNEVDTNRLADLYRLDHISSRLRRNAGSLVALSGSVGADEHVAPLPLTDIVRLALGQIEEYGRVDVDVPPSITLVPAVLGDLVLLLAELMENATNYSPPHSRVSVTAALVGYRAEIYIVDRGIGMSPDRLAEENARIARRERLDLAPTEVLGLFVVGRLARRHGVQVTLSPTLGGGVTAAVMIGQELLVETPAAPNGSRPTTTHSPTAVEATRVAPQDMESALVNVEALNRASRVLESGRRWNAFAVPPAPATASPAISPPVTPPPPAAPPPAAPPPVVGRPGLRRRVPGATLEQPSGPVRPPARTGPRPAAADPDEARILVEQLQDGVTKALGEIRAQPQLGTSQGGTEETHDDR